MYSATKLLPGERLLALKALANFANASGTARLTNCKVGPVDNWRAHAA
jgi:hypothetical protein